LTGKRSLRSFLLSAIMIPVAAIIGIPFYYVLVNTFKTQRETATAPLALPSSPFFGNYTTALNTMPIAQSFGNTIYITVLSVALMLVVGAFAAYAMVMRQTRWNRIISTILLIAFVVPFQTLLLPLYLDMANAGLTDSLNGLVLVYAVGSIFCFFLIQGYMKTVPYEIVEAARIDGAGTFQIFWMIMLPLIRPILVTVGVFQTMWVWNDFLIPQVFISSPEKYTLVLQVYSAVGEFSVNWPMFLTVTAITLAPMVVFFIFMQKHIVSGLINGAVKG
jgi:raffinose/stachyose/melibiose transport system permease protein